MCTEASFATCNRAVQVLIATFVVGILTVGTLGYYLARFAYQCHIFDLSLNCIESAFFFVVVDCESAFASDTEYEATIWIWAEKIDFAAFISVLNRNFRLTLRTTSHGTEAVALPCSLRHIWLNFI